jgi:hypothetical protein
MDRNVREQREVTPLDDDGFESLNGNGSSENGEEAAEDGEETRRMPCKVAEDLSRRTRSALNWKSSVQDTGNFSIIGKKQNEISHSSLNYNSQRSEGSVQGVKFSSSDVAVPTVQVTQRVDILRVPDEQEPNVENIAHVGCLRNDSYIDETVKLVDPLQCSETKCKVPDQTDDNTQKLVADPSPEYSNERSQRKKLINEKEHERLSESSADERHTPLRNFRVQDMSCRNPSADSDTDITDAEIRDRSPQVTHS